MIKHETPSAAARPLTNESLATNSPSSEMITVMPANITARPAESRALTAASSG